MDKPSADGAVWKLHMTASVIADVQYERERQKQIEGWTPEHDAQHADGELAKAAACYALATAKINGCVMWPWDWSWWKPKTRRRDLVRAAALIIAEIERLDIAALEFHGPKISQRREATP